MKNIALAQFVAILILTTFLCVLSVKIDALQQYIIYLELSQTATKVCFTDEWRIEEQYSHGSFCVTKNATSIDEIGTTTLYGIYRN